MDTTVTLHSAFDQPDIKETKNTDGRPVEWWYMNALVEASGTPLDGWALVVTLPRFGTAIEEGRFLLIPPAPGEKTIDFGTGRLNVGAIEASYEQLEVRFEDRLALTGGFPDYVLQVSGYDGARRIAADLSYTADLEPENLTHLDGQLSHLVCYRLRCGGTISIGADTYDVTGIGFYERVYGSLGWEPGEQLTLSGAGTGTGHRRRAMDSSPSRPGLSSCRTVMTLRRTSR